ncbi:hypothetical protein [Maridesulfovibrio sp.]|uniref:hypothetical protein n=1 Tax=Maridesulfovibrio sp. TaxID=2795000 RepID=UPI0029CA9063|nr:hypothetical protein [Maridesulfovibrio sp.]
MTSRKFNVKLACLKAAAVEREFDVNSVTFGGMQVWPLIRFMLYDQLTWGKGNFISTGEVWFNKFDYDRKFPEFSRSMAGTDILWLSNPEYYTDKIDGKYFCRFEDPFIELFDKGNIKKIELRTALSVERSDRLHKPHYFCPSVSVLRAPVEKLPEIKNFDEVAAVIKAVCGARIAREQLLEIALNVFSYFEYFLDMLQVIRPKAVFFACYYSRINMGLIRACRHLGIPSVDYQHGKQGKFHGMYTHWTAIPPEGYELLPRYFWSWGEESAYNISRWMGDAGRMHQTLVGGSPWLYLWVNGMCSEDADVIREFERLFSGKKTILVCLQRTEDGNVMLLDSMISAMRDAPQDWCWLLRLPPAFRDRREVVVEKLKANGISNYEFDITNRASLYTLLKRVDHHVTTFSSVCYEALSFGINTVVVHPIAKALYPEYIEKGYFIYAQTGEQIICSIKEGMEGDFISEENPYIVSDIKSARKNIYFFLSQNKM